ncbi:Hypothetical_protein [Hexamita inflata]|uniref:Hypothetical_protein n=1 Tax=Hexamita inflata TaxID=28002 RepID=A0ABP1GE34_9EUKA
MQNADQKQKCCLVTEETRFTDDDVRNSALFDGENIALEVDKQRYLIKIIYINNDYIQIMSKQIIILFSAFRYQLPWVQQLWKISENSTPLTEVEYIVISIAYFIMNNILQTY